MTIWRYPLSEERLTQNSDAIADSGTGGAEFPPPFFVGVLAPSSLSSVALLHIVYVRLMGLFVKLCTAPYRSSSFEVFAIELAVSVKI